MNMGNIMDDIPTNVLAAFIGYSNNMRMNQELNRVFGSGSDADYNRVLVTSLNDQSPVRNVLSEQGENQIKTRKFTKDDECDSCPIFHIPFEIGEEVKELPCGHIFTPDGIDKWLKEEKAECPVCRFKLKSKEITREAPGVEQWSDDRNEIYASRAALASSLRRLTFPRINLHPFGPSSHRIANVVHEDDENDDIMRALTMTIHGGSIFNNIVNNHSSGGNNSFPSIVSNITYVNDNNYLDNSYYDLRDMSDNSTNTSTSTNMNINYTSVISNQPQMLAGLSDIAASYDGNRFLTASSESPSQPDTAPSVTLLQANNENSSSQDNRNTSDN